MKVATTTTRHENSITISRPDGTVLDYVFMDNEIIIGCTNSDGSHVNVTLSLEEARELQSHLNAVLG